jgi:hypothetical protein
LENIHNIQNLNQYFSMAERLRYPIDNNTPIGGYPIIGKHSQYSKFKPTLFIVLDWGTFVNTNAPFGRNPTFENKTQNCKSNPTFFNVIRAKVRLLVSTHPLRGMQTLRKRNVNLKSNPILLNVTKVEVPLLVLTHLLEKTQPLK